MTPFDFEKSERVFDMDAEGGVHPVPILDLPGMDAAIARRLAALRVDDTAGLLSRCRDAAQRTGLARAAEVDEAQLLRWARLADLARVRGIGTGYATLLVGVGVKDCADLAGRDARPLADAMLAFNTAGSVTRLVPSAAVVVGWVEQAKRYAAQGRITEESPPRGDAPGSAPGSMRNRGD